MVVTVIGINYPNGTISIDCDVYLQKAKISQWRKIIKLCEQYAPHNLDVLRDFMLQNISYAEQTLPTLESYVKELERRLETVKEKVYITKCQRDNYHRGTKKYMQYNELLKEQKGELENVKYVLSGCKRKYKARMRSRDKAQKLLNYLE